MRRVLHAEEEAHATVAVFLAGLQQVSLQQLKSPKVRSAMSAMLKGRTEGRLVFALIGQFEREGAAIVGKRFHAAGSVMAKPRRASAESKCCS
jgi:hypothetical protein